MQQRSANMSDMNIISQGNTSISTDFSKFESFLTSLALPTENIIANPNERARIMAALPEFINSLPIEIRREARYLSKFIAGSAVGLFDSSLNYVWNEVVINLRKKVVIYGLDTFFDEAVGTNIRDQYKSEDDLSAIKDRTLLDICFKLELITEIVYKKLIHILEMRNDIGSSHPNTYSINSYELLGWLQTCIGEVLQENISDAAITVRTIIDNIKKNTQLIEKATIESFSKLLASVSSNLIGNLLKTLFGIFVSQKSPQITNENILAIAPFVWHLAKEEQKYALGISVDNYRTVLDESKVNLAEIFFEKCDGNRYFTKDARIIKLNELCDNLLKVHYEWDNFYHEVPIIKHIMAFIKKPEDIPFEIREKVLRNILICRIGREVNYYNGVSPGGRTYYDIFFKLLNKDQVILILKLFTSSDIKHNVYEYNTKKNFKEILYLIKSPIHGDKVNEIIDLLLSMKDPQNAIHVREYQEIARGIVL
jgi:hypothetical protein